MPRSPPPTVRTHAERALAAYPELRVDGLDSVSQVFALVAESLGQLPASSSTESAGGKKTRRDWVKKLHCVFIFEITPPSPPKSPPPLPQKVYLNLHPPIAPHPITLTPPAILSTSRAAKRQAVTIALGAADLVAVAVGEKIPVKLYASGGMKIKGDPEKALKLGQLLRITRSQIYHPLPASSPSSNSAYATAAAGVEEGDNRHGLSGEGLHGLGSGSGDVGVGLGVKARL